MSDNDKLNDYVDGVFAPYEGAKSISDLKADLLADLHERFRELKAEGKDDAAAFELTIDSIGDIEWYWGDESQGGRRKYFRITEKGKSTYANNKSNWEYAKRVLDKLL